LASAHQALIKAGLEPELLLCTDPGFWNGAHLAMAARQGSMVAATPSTRLGNTILDGPCPVVPVCTDLGFELDALAAAGDVPAIPALPSGTAAGSALSVAGYLNTGPIYLCGFDLAARALAEHVSPYAFDVLDTMRSSRLTPELACRFGRVMDGYPLAQGEWRLSRAFSAYALDAAIGSSNPGIFRISNSPVDTPIQRVHPEHLLASRSVDQGSDSSRSRVRFFNRRMTATARFEAMIERLTRRAKQAVARLKECAGIGIPVPHGTVLELFAFGGKGCASAIANAARGETCSQELLDAETAVLRGLEDLAGGAS
jgi:hypothetical protein